MSKPELIARSRDLIVDADLLAFDREEINGDQFFIENHLRVSMLESIQSNRITVVRLVVEYLVDRDDGIYTEARIVEGVARRDPHDRQDPGTGMFVAMARAMESATRIFQRQATGRVKHADDMAALRKLPKQPVRRRRRPVRHVDLSHEEVDLDDMKPVFVMDSVVNDNFVFIDLETTGLDPQRDQICEIAAVPTDRHLEQLDDGFSIVVCPLGKRYRDLDAVVKRMHTENGLWAETQRDDALWPTEAAQKTVQYLAQFGQKRELPMAGSSIGFDRRFLSAQMPMVDDWFHYRSIDVSSLKEIWKRFFPNLGEPPKGKKAHRALGDCIDSIAELRWYRDRLTVKGGGDVLATTPD